MPGTLELDQPAVGNDKITVAGDPVQTSVVRFARWHQAFTEPGGALKSNWIKDDDDRVVIRVSDQLIDEAFPSVEVKVTGIDGALTGRSSDTDQVKLEKKDGVWESDPLIFVADSIDADKYNGDLGDFSGKQRDQTRLAGFDADISVIVHVAGGTMAAEFSLAKMMKPARTLKVNVNTMEMHGAIRDDAESAQQAFNQTKLLYRQIGIDLIQQNKDVGNVPLRADFVDVLENDAENFSTSSKGKKNEMFSEYIANLAHKQKVMQVYFAQFHIKSQTDGDIGYAPQPGDYAFISLFDMQGNILLGGSTAAHEIGHATGLNHSDLVVVNGKVKEDGTYPHRVLNSSVVGAKVGDEKVGKRFGIGEQIKFYELLDSTP